MTFFNLQSWRHVVFALTTTSCHATADIDPFCTNTEFGYDRLATSLATGRDGEPCVRWRIGILPQEQSQCCCRITVCLKTILALIYQHLARACHMRGSCNIQALLHRHT